MPQTERDERLKGALANAWMSGFIAGVEVRPPNPEQLAARHAERHCADLLKAECDTLEECREATGRTCPQCDPPPADSGEGGLRERVARMEKALTRVAEWCETYAEEPPRNSLPWAQQVIDAMGSIARAALASTTERPEPSAEGGPQNPEKRGPPPETASATDDEPERCDACDGIDPPRVLCFDCWMDWSPGLKPDGTVRMKVQPAERPEPETGEPEPDAWLVEWKGTIHSAREDRPPHDLFTEPDWNIVPVYRQPTPERVAQIQAHRACLGTEHDPENGKMHGCCVVCGVPWPCEYVGQPPADSGEGGLREALERIKRLADSRDDSTVLFWDAVKIARNALASTTERPEPDDEEEKDDAEV